MALERENQTYQDKLHELEQHQGKYVLIKGEEIVGIYDTYRDALNDGYAKFNLTPFLVKLIDGIVRAHLITRMLA